MKSGTVRTFSGSLLAVDAPAAGRFQRRLLNSGVRIIRGEVRVTDQDCTKLSPIELILQYRFAIPNPLKSRRGPNRCTTARLCNPILHMANATPCGAVRKLRDENCQAILEAQGGQLSAHSFGIQVCNGRARWSKVLFFLDNGNSEPVQPERHCLGTDAISLGQKPKRLVVSESEVPLLNVPP